MQLKHPIVKPQDGLGKLVLVRDLFVATRPDIGLRIPGYFSYGRYLYRASGGNTELSTPILDFPPLRSSLGKSYQINGEAPSKIGSCPAKIG